MSEHIYWYSRTLVRRGLVKLVSWESGHFHFKVKGYDVFHAPKLGWSCSAGKREKDLSVGCVIFGNRGRLCSHILAAKHWLKSFDLRG